MQKKQLNSILIIIVIAIWGGLIYKFIAPFFNKNKGVMNISERLSITKEIKIQSKDTFELNELDHDPFLAKSYYKPIHQKTSVKKKKKISKKIAWPKITYLGFVKAKTNKTKLGLIRIDKKLCKVRTFDKVDNINVIKITNDSICLKMGSEKKYFKK